MKMFSSTPFASVSLPCPTTMRSAFVFIVVAGLAGCGGNLSQEDLLFRVGIPAKSSLAVTPPGIEAEVASALDDDGGVASQALQQALEEQCADGDLLCATRNVARVFNGTTFALLDIVDAISALPPSLREPGRRVWGPHFDDARGTSFRFEMLRTDSGFDFCLHSAVGRLSATDASNALTCNANDVDTADDEADVERRELLQVLSGSFAPSTLAGGAARRGSGTMHLEAGRLARFRREARIARSADFVFDNSAGATVIDISLNGTVVDTVERDAAYHFNRSVDGDGALTFEFFDEFVAPQAPLFPPQSLERMVLSAAWNADRAGRASAVVDGGNAAGTFTIEQCWDAELNIVYDNVFGTESGDAQACVDTENS